MSFLGTMHVVMVMVKVHLLPTPLCPHCAASLTLDLLSTGGGSCDSNPLALCLSSFKIDIAATSCAVTVTPLLASNTYVAGIWSSSSSTGTYTRLMACPTWAREAVTPSGGQAGLQAAIELAIEQHIYGSGYPQTLSSSWNEAGQVTLTTTTGSCTLKYAITQVRLPNALRLHLLSCTR